jgi:hypothetical protein
MPSFSISNLHSFLVQLQQAQVILPNEVAVSCCNAPFIREPLSSWHISGAEGFQHVALLAAWHQQPMTSGRAW